MGDERFTEILPYLPSVQKLVICLSRIRFPLPSIGLAVEDKSMPMISFIMGVDLDLY